MNDKHNLKPLIWIVHNAEPFPSSGDRKWRCGMLSHALEQQGCNVKRFKSNWNHFEKNRIKNVALNSRKINYYKTLGYNHNRSIRRLAHQFLEPISCLNEMKKLQKPHFVVISIPTLELAGVLAKWCVKNKIPYAIDIRDKWPDHLEKMVSKFTKLLLYFLFNYYNKQLKYALNHACIITTISNSYKQWAEEKSLNKNAFVFPICYDYGENIPTITNKIKNKKLTLVYCGSLSDAFDLESVYNVLKKFSQFTIYIIGDGPLLKTLKAIKMTNVIYTGWLNNRQLVKYLQTCHFGLTPYVTKTEISLPNKPFEYLYQGLPLINSLKGDLWDLVEHYKIGFNYSNECELIEIFEKIQNYSLRLKLYNNVQKCVKNSRFDYKVQYHKMSSIFLSKLST